jgi:hypothetical protein
MALDRTHRIDGWLDNELGIKHDGIAVMPVRKYEILDSIPTLNPGKHISTEHRAMMGK